ncbi:MAG: hypothetical protein WCT14_06240 [Treponemataceae bacterium]
MEEYFDRVLLLNVRVIAAMAGLAFLLALLFSPKYGLVIRAAAKRRMRLDFDTTMITVHLFHHERTVEKSLSGGLVERSGELLTLTERGREKARAVIER